MNDFWRRLLYRWFIQYNPLYLVSAMLVLGGTVLTSKGLATEGSLYGPLGVAAIAELYAVALIGGAALLTRIGQRRAAVMLALLTALYQCDLTLHTETCASLGTIGAFAAAGWFALFALKLFALAWATKVHLSRAAIATALVGGAALVLGPFLMDETNASQRGAIVAAVVFALGVLGPAANVTSKDTLDAWGQTVLRRTVASVRALWGLLFALHVLFWAADRDIALQAVVPAAALLVARRVRKEGATWAIAATVSAFVALAAPGLLAVTLLLAAATLALGAFDRVPVTRRIVGETSGPYRMGETHTKIDWELVLVPIGPAAKARLLAGALLSLYGGVWSIGWRGGAWPAHSVALDLFVLVVAIAIALRVRPRLSLLVPAFAGTHALAVSGLVPTPHTMLGWGSSALALGFALLLGALATSYRLRRLTAPDG
ncbi:MAG: hypothetical protein KIT84_19515 [Labilithrix sp.]|nr:hypothetical protein [Labilithrix sp.]MCW5813225.1 hypothetical protein [Labilithrix sp.]